MDDAELSGGTEPEPEQRFRFERDRGRWPEHPPSSAETEEPVEDQPSVDEHRSRIADGVERRVAPESIRVDRIASWITLLILAGGGAVAIGLTASLATALPTPLRLGLLGLWVVLTAGGIWLAQAWPVLQWRHTSFRVDERGIEIRKGVLWQRVINVPRSRIQHTDVSQGPLQRRYQLSTLIIHTAGTEHATVDLTGLSHATALRIRDHLISGEGDDAV